MRPEEQAVIDAAELWSDGDADDDDRLLAAVDALRASRGEAGGHPGVRQAGSNLCVCGVPMAAHP